MPLSRYLITCRDHAFPDEVLLFSTRTGALVQMVEEQFAALQRGTHAPEYDTQLREMGLLVDDQAEEQEQVLGYMNEINRLTPNLTVAVVLGMECNFSCPYCFEGLQKGNKSMSDATADQLIHFIKERLRPGKNKLKLQLYGGEPLLYSRRILSLAKQLKPFAEEQGGSFSMDMVSNGSLLNEKIVDKLTPWGLDGVKVTLDGPPEIHNRNRPFKSGEKSFAIIIENLKKVCSKTKIRLGGNYSQDNYHQFPAVLDLLTAEGVGPESIELVNFNMVMQVNESVTGNRFQGGCSSVNEPWLRDASLYVRQEVLRRGYAVPEISPQPCAVEMDDAYTVHFDGSLYKCVTWIGNEAYKIGDIWNGADDSYLHTHHVGHWKKNEECRACIYLPLCFGGCRFMAHQRNGHMAEVDCQKDFFASTLEHLIKQDIAQPEHG
ncbi:MAG: geopeptide radical SAM maturase [Desulfobulbaceae bacterium]|uniref:Geopeptide radical SAM maturase n=1 Tax=Candidatus Desulfatifera sulfidica TaxID=2841691 RepID=A0A8J6TCJ5_9BACT|nr:geopeptide radical SAM maturase [Candidatus Desulfatifera sulfidica]